MFVQFLSLATLKISSARLSVAIATKVKILFSAPPCTIQANYECEASTSTANGATVIPGGTLEQCFDYCVGESTDNVAASHLVGFAVTCNCFTTCNLGVSIRIFCPNFDIRYSLQIFEYFRIPNLLQWTQLDWWKVPEIPFLKMPTLV